MIFLLIDFQYVPQAALKLSVCFRLLDLLSSCLSFSSGEIAGMCRCACLKFSLHTVFIDFVYYIYYLDSYFAFKNHVIRYPFNTVLVSDIVGPNFLCYFVWYLFSEMERWVTLEKWNRCRKVKYIA